MTMEKEMKNQNFPVGVDHTRGPTSVATNPWFVRGKRKIHYEGVLHE